MAIKILFAFNLFFRLVYLTCQRNVQYQQQKVTNYSFIIPSTRILMAVCKLPEEIITECRKGLDSKITIKCRMCERKFIVCLDENKDDSMDVNHQVVSAVMSCGSDKYLCPHCSLYNNIEECELFSSSCRESEIQKNQYSDYCDNKYGQWRTKFIPANYSICQCCNDCVFYREIGESCVHNSNYNIYVSETLPVITEDLRAGCNPYKGHPNEASKSLECDEKSDTCVLMNSFNPKKDEKKDVNPNSEQSTESTYMLEVKSGLPYKIQVAEPCKLEMRKFTKQFGTDGQSHFNAPQCTTLWKYRPVQCRGLRCYCAQQDGTALPGFDVPRADVSNMNCACAREKCATNNDLLECDGYGNYKKFCFVYLKEDYPPSQGNHVPLLRIEKLDDEIVYTPGVMRGLAHQTFAVTKSINSSLITKTDDVDLPLKIESRLNITEASPGECLLDETTSTKFSVLHYQMRNNAVLIPQLKFFFDDDEPL